MRRTVLMPSVEVGMVHGRFIEYLVDVGAIVSAGDFLFTVEGEKAAMDIESPVGGIVVELLAPPDSELAVGAEVLVIEVATA